MTRNFHPQEDKGIWGKIARKRLLNPARGTTGNLDQGNKFEMRVGNLEKLIPTARPLSRGKPNMIYWRTKENPNFKIFGWRELPNQKGSSTTPLQMLLIRSTPKKTKNLTKNLTKILKTSNSRSTGKASRWWLRKGEGRDPISNSPKTRIKLSSGRTRNPTRRTHQPPLRITRWRANQKIPRTGGEREGGSLPLFWDRKGLLYIRPLTPRNFGTE